MHGTQSTKYQGDGVRRVIAQFTPANIVANQPMVDLLRRIAEQKHATPARISLAWMLAKEPFIAPIPGSRKPERIKENLGAADMDLSVGELAELEAELSKIPVHGNRTDRDIAKLYQHN